jgi:hypothetical protein
MILMDMARTERDTIAHVDIPEHIQAAFTRLQDGLAGDFQSRSMLPRPSLA